MVQPAKNLIIITILLLNNLLSFGQTATEKLVARIDKFADNVPEEKVYLHTDKPYYTNTDTVWLKAYVLNKALEGSRQSGLLYVELIDAEGKIAQSQCLPVFLGISFGQMALDSTLVPEGGYTLRAYTRWMQNQENESFFNKSLFIGAAKTNALYTVSSKLSEGVKGYNNTVNLRLTDIDAQALRLKDYEISLFHKRKRLYRQTLQTDLDGQLNFNFDLADKDPAGNLKLLVNQKSQPPAIIPLTVNRPENTDVQFMPEGGNLVEGLTSRVGFKAVAEDGKGVDVHGSLIDSDGKEVLAFASGYKGMGSFIFTPAAGLTYTARLIFQGGKTKDFILPKAKSSGVVLTVNNIPGRDSIMVTLQSTADFPASTGSMSLIAQSMSKVCYASAVRFDNNYTAVGNIAKSKFPAGVSRFTVLNAAGRPLAERIIFIKKAEELLHVDITADKTVYNTGDSIALALKVTGKDGLPVTASFSLAVTDDAQIKADSDNVADINTYMLLQSELKGAIETPGYYFTNTAQTASALDNLMLTQGWVAYNWQQVLGSDSKPKYLPEPEIAVSGVVQKFNKPKAGVIVTLFSNNPFIVRDTVTDAFGRFSFKSLPRFDTTAFAIKVKNKNGKTLDVEVLVDKFDAAGTKDITYPEVWPWYVNAVPQQLTNIKQNAALQAHELSKISLGGNVLKEVTITANKIVKGSKNLHGPGVADQVLDEETIIKAGDISLLDLLVAKIKGFALRTLPTKRDSPAILYYGVYDKQVKFVMDGVDLDTYFQPQNLARFRDWEHYQFLKLYLDPLRASDIRGVEIMYNERYSNKYQTTYESQSMVSPKCLYCAPPRYKPLVYVEITTWNGQGVSVHRIRGTAFYRPLPVSWPKLFYTSKYVNKTNVLFNLRPTVFWEPNLISNDQGKARVSFFTKLTPGNYTLILQGADLNGGVISKTLKLSTK